MVKRGGFSVLTAAVDGDVLALVNPPLNVGETVAYVNHIVFFGVANACCVEISHNAFKFFANVVKKMRKRYTP